MNFDDTQMWFLKVHIELIENGALFVESTQKSRQVTLTQQKPRKKNGIAKHDIKNKQKLIGTWIERNSVVFRQLWDKYQRSWSHNCSCCQFPLSTFNQQGIISPKKLHIIATIMIHNILSDGEQMECLKVREKITINPNWMYQSCWLIKLLDQTHRIIAIESATWYFASHACPKWKNKVLWNISHITMSECEWAKTHRTFHNLEQKQSIE